MEKGKRVISVRTPSITYEKCNDEQIRCSRHVSLVRFKEVMRDTNLYLNWENCEGKEENSEGQFLCRGVGISRSRFGSRIGKRKKEAGFRKSEAKFDEEMSYGIRSPNESHFVTKVATRYMFHNKSTEVRFLKRRFGNNGMIVVDKILTPTNLYAKEFQKFSSPISVGRRNGNRSVNIRKNKLFQSNQFMD
jgi:hypothetical protein